MAKKAVSSLSVILGATVKPFVGAFASVQKVVGNFVIGIGRAGSTLLKFTGIGGAIAALAGGAGLGYLITQQSEAIDGAAKLSDRLGISTEALAGLQHAADLSGVSTEQLTGGLQKYLKNVSEAAGGNDQLAGAFKALGLDAKDLINLPTDQAMGKIGDALNAITNPAQRAAAAQEIFGKAGQELLPLLAEGSDGLSEMAREAAALGLTFSRVDAAKVEEANDAISRVKAAFVGVIRQITVALAPAIKWAADAMTGWGMRVVAIVQAYLPRVVSIISGVMMAAWSIITTVWSAVYNFVAPIVAQIAGFIAANWRSIVTTTTTYFLSVWNVISAVAGAAWSLITAVWTGIVGVWDWACNLLGVETTSTGATVGGVFGNIVAAGQWMQTTLAATFNILAFALNNFTTIVEYVGTSAAYYIVQFANVATYWFGVVIDYVVWFGQNFFGLMSDAFSNTITLAQNFGRNIVAIISNLPGLIAGTTDWSEVLTPLTDGFISTVGELPTIAERIPGDLEAALGAQSSELGDTLANGLFDSLNAADKQAANVASNITGAIQSAGNFQLPEIKAPTMPNLAMPIDDATDAMGDLNKKTKETTASWKALAFGSAEAMQASAQAAFKSQLPDPSPSSSPQAAPLASKAATGMQQAAKDRSASGGKDDLASLVRSILDEIKGMDRVELAEAA